MAEFVDVIRQTKRICKSVNGNCGRCLMGEFACPNNARFDNTDEQEFIDFANAVMSWAAEHPEPVYPTWEDWLLDIGVIRKGMSWSDLNIPLRKSIPANIAEKLGLQPKEYMKCCENCAWYEEEWEYCFRKGNHAPKDGYCDHYPEKLPKEK